MRKLNEQEEKELIKSYDMTDDMEVYDSTSYSLVIKDERTGAFLPYRKLTKLELDKVVGALDPHGFFSTDSWYKEEVE